MRRITLWISTTIVILALVLAYQLNATGIGGKTDDDRNETATTRPTATCTTTCPAPTGADQPGTAGKTATGPAITTAAPKPEDGGADTDPTGKPGENK